MKQIIPEIYINNCREALDFYLRLFGGEVKNVRISDDMPMFREIKGKVIHSELHVNGRCVFYFVDALEAKRQKLGNVTLVLHMDEKEELEKCYQALKRGGVVAMAPRKTQAGAWHAIVTDRFGAPWALNYREHTPDTNRR